MSRMEKMGKGRNILGGGVEDAGEDARSRKERRGHEENDRRLGQGCWTQGQHEPHEGVS